MPRRRPSPSFILAVLSFGVFVAADDLTVVSTMLRQIIFDLEIPLPDGLDDAAWIVNAYLIAYVIVMPFAGRVSDIIGRRPVYIASFTLFLLGSIWVPLAGNLHSFIFGRVLTALGGGALVPVGMAIIGDIYESRKRPSALGTLGAIDTAGWVWGPLYGALLVRFLNWRWQFYLNIPLSIIGIVTAWWVLRDLPRVQSRRRIDWLGTIILMIALLALNIALLNSSNIQTIGNLSELTGQESSSTLPLFILSLVFFVLFIIVERTLSLKTAPERNPSSFYSKVRLAIVGKGPRRTAPLIDMALFRRKNFSPAVLVNFLVGAILIIAMINVPLLVNVLEFDVRDAALSSGLLLSAMTASMAVMAYFGGRLTERWSYKLVTMLGLGACTTGFIFMGLSWTSATTYSQMIWQLVILGAGFGLVMAPIGAAVINAAQETQRGIAASLVIVFRLIGMSVGLSSLTAWGLERFNVLRDQIEIPGIEDPGFQAALTKGLTDTTVSVLTETFLISGFIAIAAILLSLLLQKDDPETDIKK